MEEYYQHIKALHIIFVITWFAGLFYIPRLFIYHIESTLKSDVEKTILSKQFKIMSKRLWYIITWPSAILAIFFGIWMLILNPILLEFEWMKIKLCFVVLLIIYHVKTNQIFNELQKDIINYSSTFMRYWNEGATIILFAIIFLVTLKNTTSWIFGVVGIIGLSALLMLGIKFYKKLRKK